MKATKYILLLWTAALCLTACTNSTETDEPAGDGIIEQSWTYGQVFEISTSQDVTVRFTTTGDWTATFVAGSNNWCTLSQKSGGKGSHSLIATATSETSVDRSVTVSILAVGEEKSTIFKLKQKKSKEKEADEKSEDELVNEAVDTFLSDYYLWNSEWKGLTKDFSQEYEDFFYNNLYSMTTNTLDKKYYYTDDSGLDHYTLFSYIQKKDEITNTRTTQIKKELEYSLGFTGLTPIQIVDKDGNFLFLIFCVEGVYPDSPASKSGLKRGSYIYKVNDAGITTSNYEDLFYDLLYPEEVNSQTITEWLLGEDGYFAYDDNKKQLTAEHKLTVEAMYKNPVLHHEVITAETGQKVGYLVYDNFDAGFDEELFDVFKEFKTAGIQDLVLDLRYNGGGHVVSANMMASCVAGSYCNGRVFSKYRYNEERMKSKNDSDLEEKFLYGSYTNLGRNFSLAAGDLSLNRLYCLVGGGTASASELVINALRGIDIGVVLIGETTHGKNVGMEVETKVINDHTYEIAPITFQTYNAKGFGDYENGFTPDIETDESAYERSSIFYRDYGDPKEILLARALQEITGIQPATTRASARRSSAFGKLMKRPTVRRPGHEGMIKPLQR